MLRRLEDAIARRSLIEGKRRSRSPFPPPPAAPGAEPVEGTPVPAPIAPPPSAPARLDDDDPSLPPAPLKLDVPADDDPLRAPTPSAISRQVEPPRPFTTEPPRLPWDEAPAEPPAPPVGPALEVLRERTDEIVKPSGPLIQYVKHQDPGEGATPFLADKPFGDQTFFGNQMTPFFVNEASPVADYDTDDTDGIPTGLPNLLDLPPIGTAPPAPAARRAADEPSTDLPPLPRELDGGPEFAITPSHQLNPAIPAAGGFLLGALVGAILGLLLG